MSCFLILMLLCLADGSVEPKSGDLASKLKSEILWIDPDLEQTLNTHLEEAKKNPTDKVIAVLIEHIDYDIYAFGGRRRKLIGIEKQYAVVGVLSEIGLLSVPALVDSLKRIDPEDKKNDGVQKQVLAIFCLRDIYDRGGFGKALARKRIELETQRATDKEKKFLQDVLDHPYLNMKE